MDSLKIDMQEGLDEQMVQIAKNEDIFTMDVNNLMDPSTNQDPKAKKWRSQSFKQQLGTFIKQNYRRDDIKITNKFAKLFYTKQYLMGIQNSNGFSKAEKIFLHPNLTMNDSEYLEKTMHRIQMYKYLIQFGSLGLLMVSYYKNKKFYELMKKDVYKGTAIIGAFPILVMAVNYQIVEPVYMHLKVNSSGLVEKYGVR